MNKDINEILKRPCHNASSPFGANMGRKENKIGSPERLHLQRIRFIDGDYDTGGAYWGGGTPLYCAFSDERKSPNDNPIMIFTRANNRTEAKKRILAELEGSGWTFFQ